MIFCQRVGKSPRSDGRFPTACFVGGVGQATRLDGRSPTAHFVVLSARSLRPRLDGLSDARLLAILLVSRCFVERDECADGDVLRVLLARVGGDLFAVEVDVAIEHELHLTRQVLGVFALEQQPDFRRDDVEGAALVARDDRRSTSKRFDGDEPERLVA